jgi:hypothetical protein
MGVTIEDSEFEFCQVQKILLLFTADRAAYPVGSDSCLKGKAGAA